MLHNSIIFHDLVWNWETTFSMHYTAKEHLITNDNGVAIIFEQKCVFQPNDQRLTFAKLKYVKWVEEIMVDWT